MNIETLSCDICNHKEPYSRNPTHEHSELELGGVPVSIWTPEYHLPKDNEIKISRVNKGISKFSRYIPVHLDKKIVSNEGNTPLVKCSEFPANTYSEVYIKDESHNPTGSFKDRGIAALVSEASYSGMKKIAIPSTGNAAISLGYYGNRAGIGTIVFIPQDTPRSKVNQIEKHSEIISDRNIIESYEHFFRFCKKNKEVYNGFPANNIYYLQGLKTTAYEIFMQLGNRIPDQVIIPVGSGGNFVGLYHGFRDLMNMCITKKMPRFVSVQLQDADPITVGFREKQLDRLMVLDSIPKTKAEAIASDTCFNYFKILKIISETKGHAISVSEAEIENAPIMNFEYSSMSVFPAFEKLAAKKDRYNDLGVVVLICTASNKGD